MNSPYAPTMSAPWFPLTKRKTRPTDDAAIPKFCCVHNSLPERLKDKAAMQIPPKLPAVGTLSATRLSTTKQKLFKQMLLRFQNSAVQQFSLPERLPVRGAAETETWPELMAA